jgi:nitrite reductase (NADH) small subunit/3-phenylpropionate/trans-cinnamate dioxygenase ferredoxin subunit
MTDSVAASDFVTVAKVGDIPDGEGRAFAVNGRMVAVFNEQGKYSSIDDFCPHMGASLAGGYLENGIVTCPWHAWRFGIHDGRWCDNPKIKVDSFEVRVQGNDIQVRVPPKQSQLPPPSASEPSQPSAAP